MGRSAYSALIPPRPFLRAVEVAVAAIPFVASVSILLAMGLGFTA